MGCGSLATNGGVPILAVDLSTFAGSNYTRVGERGMMIYGSERTAAEIAAIDRYLGVV